MKDFCISILKMIITMILIFITPFILPLFFKMFLNLKWFESIEEFTNVTKLFYSAYPVIYIIITLALMLWFFHKWTDIKDFFNSRDWTFGYGDKIISAKIKAEEVIKESDNKKEFVSNMKQNNKTINSDSIIDEIKTQLGMAKISNKKDVCQECKKDELEKENNKLRYFAAYNMINIETKSLLHIIYNEKYVNIEKFKSQIIQGYKRRNKKNVKFTGKELSKIANNKYETIYEGLKFLNIIEPSEDDKIVKLTREGKEFVKEYIEKEVV